MPAGLPYFAWIDASETTFGSEHQRWDEQIFSFTLAQEEGDPATLTIAVRRPRNVAGDPIGLLGPGRKIWCWFALDCGPALIKFRGRLVGVPTSLFEDLVTLEFVARPIDMVVQKEALANTLRVLPYYDPVVLDPDRRKDPDVVLEGYTKVWHFDRETHIVTVSDEISGEDGLINFDGVSDTGKVLWDGLGLNLTTGPLSRVDVAAEFTWTQSGYGTVDLTRYLISNWPGSRNGRILSFTMSASDWPKTGANIGDGWIAVVGEARDEFDFSKSNTETTGFTIILEGDDGGDARAQYSQTITRPVATAPRISAGNFTYENEVHISWDSDGDASGFSQNITESSSYYGQQAFRPTLIAGWKAERQCTEKVSFSLFADVQHILTDPENGEALRIDNVRSINLSDSKEGTPIGNPLRRSYIATDRGNQSIEHLIALARAHLMKRARVVEITFAPKLARMPEITLRKNLFLLEPRIGEASGKIISYSLALDGSDGRINCEVRIGCTIGRGGTIVAVSGSPTYCSTDYTGSGYQIFIDQTTLVDSSVGYEPPVAAPNDDGLNLLSALRPQEVLDQPLVVKFGPTEQTNNLKEQLEPWYKTGVQRYPGDFNNNLAAKDKAFKNMLAKYETYATFKLKSMTREFSTDYEIRVTDLKIPTGYNLEAT